LRISREQSIISSPGVEAKTFGKDVSEEEVMNRLTTFATTTVALLCLAFPGSDAFAQGKSLKEQLVGTWTMVSNVNMHPDGSKFEALGPNPRGVFMLDANGHFAITLLGEGRRKFASNNRLESTPDENKSVVQGAIAYFGTYTVNEADHTLNFHIERCTFPNWDGTDQKRSVTITGDEMKYTNTAASGGGKAELVWKRAK
jgi:Lipocalin-like domain